MTNDTENDFGFYLTSFTPWEAACYCQGLPCEDVENIENRIKQLRETNPDCKQAGSLETQLYDALEILDSLTREICGYHYSSAKTSLEIMLQGSASSIFPEDGSEPDYERVFISKESLIFWYKEIHDDNAINIKNAPDQLKDLKSILDDEQEYASEDMILCIKTWLRMLKRFRNEYQPSNTQPKSMHSFALDCLEEVLSISNENALDKEESLKQKGLLKNDGAKSTRMERILTVAAWKKRT